MRRLGLLLAAACPLALAACGSSSSTASKPPVRLSVDAPGDGAVVRDGTVEISGRVSPAGASVTVLGRSATTAGGSFSAAVPLAAGDNVIDVMATASFPSVPVRTALVDHPEFMTWPHVESDGVLLLFNTLGIGGELKFRRYFAVCVNCWPTCARTPAAR